MPNTRRNSLGRNHNKLGRFTPTRKVVRKSGSQTRKSNDHQMTIGSRAQVFHGTAHHTSGGLTKDKLMQKPSGKIVSRKASAAGKKALKHLTNAGYKAKKGEFKLFKKQ
jgi:hypothetical protein